MVLSDSVTTGSTTVWTGWVSNAGIDLGTGTGGSYTVWGHWITDNASTATQITSATVTMNIWTQWASGVCAVPAGFSKYKEPELTPEQEAARKFDRDWEAAIYENQTRNFRAAAAKAEALLKRHLDEEQKKDLDNHKHFFVKSKSGRMYKVKHGKTHNVIMVNPATKEELLELCVTTEGYHEIPEHDVMLAQKLWFEAHEDQALMQANIWDLRNRRQMLNAEQKRRLAYA